MNAKPKKKLCWNCEGATSFEEANCSYCGVYLHPSSISDSDEDEDLFNPPYKLAPEDQQNSSITQSPFSLKKSSEQSKEHTESNDELESVDDSSFSVMKNAVAPLFLLLGGSLFFIFGIALMLFSKDGMLTLHWNSDYWFLYLLVSIPMLCIGWIVSGTDEE